MPKVLDSNVPARQTMGDIQRTIALWNREARGVVITAWDTVPPAKVGGKEATVRIVLRGATVPFGPCSQQPTYDLNLRACYLALEAMRLNEQRGLGEVLRQAYAALLPAGESQLDPWEVLGLRPGASAKLIRAAFSALSHEGEYRHPDAGGTSAGFNKLAKARDMALKEAGGE